jgi:uncharacterized repeat protein (TIGR03803 family)
MGRPILEELTGVGTIFEIVNGSNTIKTLYSFNITDGANPASGLVLDAAGNLFGTTANGGHFSDGTVFEYAVGSHKLTTLASFDGLDGMNPGGNLAFDNFGNLFGAAGGGGPGLPQGISGGTIFELSGLQPTPEPSSITLLVVGSLVVCVLQPAHRRRKSKHAL